MTALYAPGSLRRPQWQILLNGSVVAGCTSMEVNSNNHYQADTWRAVWALNAIGGMTLDAWGGSGLVGQLFTLQARNAPGDQWTTLLVGEADSLRIGPVAGTVQAEGRDLTARLIEKKTQKSYLNQTSSEIAEALAGEHDLTPVVTPTTTLVQRYYQTDHDKITQDQFSRVTTEWDLLTYLAQQEGFDVFLRGRELHFQPAEQGGQQYTVTFDPVTRRLDAVDISLDRSLLLAKDVTVKVRSWHSRQGRGFTKTSGSAAGAASGKTQVYTYTRPNLTEDQAQKLADNIRADITKHERKVHLTGPVELALTCRDTILPNVGAASWEQTYYVASIAREWSEAGTMETIEAKNHSPTSEAAPQ